MSPGTAANANPGQAWFEDFMAQVQGNASLRTDVLAVFAKHPRIERYAWYPWAAHCSLVNSDGSLTALGKAYAAAPATR